MLSCSSSNKVKIYNKRKNEDPLTGQAEVVQSVLGGRVEICREDEPAVWHEEIIGAVGAPQTHEAQGAVVKSLRNLHHGCQLIVVDDPPYQHVEAAGVHGRTAPQWGAAHSEVLLSHVHNAWKDRWWHTISPAGHQGCISSTSARWCDNVEPYVRWVWWCLPTLTGTSTSSTKTRSRSPFSEHLHSIWKN